MNGETLGLLFLGLTSGGALLAFLNAKARHLRQPYRPLAPKSADQKRWRGGYTSEGNWCAAGQCIAHRDPISGAFLAVEVDAMGTYNREYEQARHDHFVDVTSTNYGPTPIPILPTCWRDDAGEPRAPAHEAPATPQLPPPPVPVYNWQGTGEVIQQEDSSGAEIYQTPTGPAVVHVRIGRR